MPTSFSERIAAWLLAGRWPLLLLALLATAACFGPARNVSFDRSIENMFAPDDPLLPPYLRLKSVFGGNEVVLAVYSDPQLLDESRQGIEKVTEISRQLKDTPGVRDVLSLAEVDRVLDKVASAAGLVQSSDVPEYGIVDSRSPIAKRFRDLFEEYTHGSDGRTAAVICMLEPQESPDATREQTVSALRDKIQRLAGGTVAGEPVMVVDGFRYVEEDGRRLGWASTILLSLVLLICFRSLRWMVLCIAVVQVALLATRALLVESGLRLSMVSSMLTAIVTVVGVATVMHLIVRFREVRREGKTPHAAFVLTTALLTAPVFWAIMTDAVGFSSLLVADVGPVRDFGLMMAVGSVLVLISAILVAPGLTLIGPPVQVRGQARIDRLLGERLKRSAFWLERRPKTILFVVLALCGAGAAGAYRLELETDFHEELPGGQSHCSSLRNHRDRPRRRRHLGRCPTRAAQVGLRLPAPRPRIGAADRPGVIGRGWAAGTGSADREYRRCRLGGIAEPRAETGFQSNHHDQRVAVRHADPHADLYGRLALRGSEVARHVLLSHHAAVCRTPVGGREKTPDRDRASAGP